jgi:hypothetical protein
MALGEGRKNPVTGKRPQGRDQMKQARQEAASAVAADNLQYVDVSGAESKRVVIRKGGTRVDNSVLNIYKFPLNLEENNIPYMLFKIFETQTTGATAATNESEAALYSGFNTMGDVAGSAAKVLNDTTFGLGGAVVDTATNLTNSIGETILKEKDIVGRAKQSFKNFSLSRNTDQLALAIALFMPDGVTASYEQQYDAISLSAVLGGAGMFAQALSAKNGGVEAIDPFIMEAASKAAGLIPGLQSSQELTNLLVFGTTGKSINPQLEMLYTSPTLRTFTFDFRLVPRNMAEAEQIKSIIFLLKRFSAPEIPAGSTGRYFIPPARFEIEFYHHDDPNTNLFKTKQCVLENISLDYAPNGYASHYDGMPVETRMSLIFRETTIIDKKAVDEGY